MPVTISLIVILFFIFFLFKGYESSRKKLNFFARGFDYGLLRSEIAVLWKLAKVCNIEEPLSLYVSENALNTCIATIIEKAKENGTEKSSETQSLLDKLYRFKTKVILKKEDKKGLENTRSLEAGQRLSIILKGKGVFKSRVLNNGTNLIILLPYKIIKKPKVADILPVDEWIEKNISVYFWRNNDAGYAFDTCVVGSGVFMNDNALFLKHTDALDRAQKRQSIRCRCEIYAQLYLIKNNETVEFDKVEVEPGYKCLLEDISEDGAMIRIGGKGKVNIPIKIQFDLNGNLVIMYGIIRAVEWNEQLEQSRLHFECTHINQDMKNEVLTFVYNVIPSEQKEINEAIVQASSAEENEDEEEDDLTEDEILSDSGEEQKVEESAE